MILGYDLKGMTMDKIEKSDWEAALAAYQQGLRADMLQQKHCGRWGVIYTIAPDNQEALERGVRQIARTRPEAVRYTRLARLRSRLPNDVTEKIIVLRTELPGRHQQAWSLETSQEIKLRVYLNKAAFEVLETALRP